MSVTALFVGFGGFVSLGHPGIGAAITAAQGVSPTLDVTALTGGTSGPTVSLRVSPSSAIIQSAQVKIFETTGRLLLVLNVSGDGDHTLEVVSSALAVGRAVEVQALVEAAGSPKTIVLRSSATVRPAGPIIVNAETSYAWRGSTGDATTLAQWSDGTLLAASFAGPAYLFAPHGNGVATGTPFGHEGGRPTIWIPQEAPHAEAALSGFGRLVARTQSGVLSWINTNFGCCGTITTGFSLDPVAAIHWRDKGGVQLDLRTGVHITGTGDPHANTLIGPDYTYAALFIGGVRRRARANLGDVRGYGVPSEAGYHTILPGALAADQSYVHSTTEAGGLVARFRPDGTTAWILTMPRPSSPIVAGGGVVVVGTAVSEDAFVVAIDLLTGTELWRAPVAAPVNDLIAADTGVVFAAMAAANRVSQLDVRTGEVRRTWMNVPAPAEMLLGNGLLYTIGGGELMALTVDATGVDPSAPWPMKFSTPQRTNHLPVHFVR